MRRVRKGTMPKQVSKVALAAALWSATVVGTGGLGSGSVTGGGLLTLGLLTLGLLPGDGWVPRVLAETPHSPAVKLILLPLGSSQAPADGRSTITLEGQILDAAGAFVPGDATVTLSTSAGQFVGVDQERDRPGFQVRARDGKFTVKLQTTLQAQKVKVRAAVDLASPATGVQITGPGTQGLQQNQPLPPVSVNNTGISTTQNDVLQPPSPRPFGTPPAYLDAYTQVEFTTNLRSPIVSGVVNIRLGSAGTDYYGSFTDFLDPNNTGTRLDVKTAVFATGRLGSWLLTGALNNSRSLNETCDGSTRLFRDTQFCDQVYPVYGDSSTSDFLTPSIDSVYFKLERTSPTPGAGSDFAMWGDYSTPELATSSQFYTATNRQLHGFKGNYNFGNLQATAFYGNNLQGFQRDTIAPNGTSGTYFLSRRLVVGGSENVFLESEELGRPGTVLERKPLNRGSDYEIDYDRGSILFRQPVQQTDFDLFGRSTVRRIVVTYQFEGSGTGQTKLYAGRLQYNFSHILGEESWAGASYLDEDQGARTFKLYGIDALVPLGKGGRLIAEWARSQNDSVAFGSTVTGNAYRIEANGSFLKNTAARLYYRSVEERFSNDATFSFTPGQTRYGGELAARVTPTTSIQLQYDHEVNFGTAAFAQFGATDIFNPSTETTPGFLVNNSLTTFRAGVSQRLGAANLGVDWVSRTRRDRINPGTLGQDSDQIVSRFDLPLTKTLAFRAQNEINLGNSDPIYPDRTTLALDWTAMPGITLRLAQQFLANSQYKSNSITSLDTLADYKLSEDTTLTGRYSILNGVNGFTSQGAVGLNHRIVLSPGLRVNLGYERIFGDIYAYTAAGQQFAQPYAVGQSAASVGVSSGDSFSVGVEYTDSPNFKASARFEQRVASTADNTVISAAATGKISPSLTALVRYQQSNFANQTIDGLSDTINAKLGLAYRDPGNDKLNVLLRYEYRQNPSTTPTTLLVGSSGTGSEVHLFALETIYAPNWRWELYGKYALRSTKSYLAQDLVGTNSISLGQLRATYRLGYRWDVTGDFRWIGQSAAGFDEIGTALELGYYLTPNLRVGAGYSFGRANDRDIGGRDRGGFFLGIQLKLNELFDGFGLQKIAPPQEQESRVKPLAIAPSLPTAASPVNPAAALPTPRTPAATPAATPAVSGSTVSGSTALPVLSEVTRGTEFGGLKP